MAKSTEHNPGMGDDFISGDDDMTDGNGQTTEIATINQPGGMPDGSLADFRARALSAPVQVMLPALAEYQERRKAFRDWLRSQLIEGLHFGFPPGCEPEQDSRGWFAAWMKGGKKYFPPEQWRPKPSFYVAGADFVRDLMAIRDEYSADMLGWEQLGKPPGTFVYKCCLFSRSTGELIGEGRGVRKVGTKGGDENNAIKMAEKSALIDAILHAYGLRDLFTQDLEDQRPPLPQNDNPKNNPKVPTATPRNSRVTVNDCKIVSDQWKSLQFADEATPEAFACWVFEVCGLPISDVRQSNKWTREQIDSCLSELERLRELKADRKPQKTELFDEGQSYL